MIAILAVIARLRAVEATKEKGPGVLLVVSLPSSFSFLLALARRASGLLSKGHLQEELRKVLSRGMSQLVELKKKILTILCPEFHP
jgi:hypothetical protein